MTLADTERRHRGVPCAKWKSTQRPPDRSRCVLMTELARLELDTTTAGRSLNGLVHAGLVLRVNGMAFPTERWTDFVLVVLTSWAEAAIKLVRDSASPVDVHFMEGPFVVRLDVASPTHWRLKILEDGLITHVRHDAEIEAGPLVESILSSSASILAYCEDHGWESRDRESLKLITLDLLHLRGRGVDS